MTAEWSSLLSVLMKTAQVEFNYGGLQHMLLQLGYTLVNFDLIQKVSNQKGLVQK